MKILFKFPNKEEISLGRLAAGDSFNSNLFGNTHNKLVSRQELGDFYRPALMLMTFEKIGAEETNTFVSASKRYLGQEVSIEFPQRNRKHTGVIISVSYEALKLDSKGNTMYNINVEFMAYSRTKINIKIKDGVDDD